jgi:peptide/nickel transport system ATP-binding protein
LSAIPVTTDAAEALKPKVSKEERATVLNRSTAIGG